MNMHHVMVCLLLLSLVLSGCQAAGPSAPPGRTLTATPVPAPSPTLAQPSPRATIRGEPASDRNEVTVSPVGLDGRLVAGTDGMPWWNDTIFYEVFVRSFYDSDADGVGDLSGLIEKLDYLNDGDPTTSQDLGVTGMWLMPIQQSPSYHGYDVVDYYRVDDEYGNHDDLLRLIKEAHTRGIRVIIDLVLNHTSSQHPWFQEALDPNSERRDWYVWSRQKPEGSGWHEHQSGYYYGYFWEGMPDLNYENPDVTEAMLDVVRFWLEDVGVDGFRLDAVKHLIEDGAVQEHTPATRAWLLDFTTFYKALRPNALTVGEVWAFTDDVVPYVGESMDLAFEFYLATAMLDSAGAAHKGPVERAQQLVLESYPPGSFATFLANHDQDRSRSQLINDEQAKLAATLQLTFPGVPFIYYGEEIGMLGTTPHENVRRPMQWTPDGGFTLGQPWRPYSEDYVERNVAGQGKDPSSILNHYRALIHLRNKHEALRIGDWQLVETGTNAVHASVRSSDEEVILVLVNLGHRAVDQYSLSLPSGPLVDEVHPVLLLGEGTLYRPAVNESGGFDSYRPLDTLRPHSSYIIQFAP